jgi:hypothetical protein
MTALRPSAIARQPAATSMTLSTPNPSAIDPRSRRRSRSSPRQRANRARATPATALGAPTPRAPRSQARPRAGRRAAAGSSP